MKGRTALLIGSLISLACIAWNGSGLLGQATISIPAASGGGILRTITRPGINTSGAVYFGNGQMLANLIEADNPSFNPTTWMVTSRCASGSTTSTWIDFTQTGGGTQSANFWAGAPYQVLSGADRGSTGTITASVAPAGTTGTEFTLSPALSSACSPSGQGDMMLVGPINVSTTAAQDGGGEAYRLNGSGTATYAVGDTPSSSPDQTQSLDTTAGENVLFYFDAFFGETGSPQQLWLNLNGTYTLTFWAKGVTAGSSLTATITRSSGTLLSYTPTLVINPTSGAGWTQYTQTFTASETGAQTANALLTIATTSGETRIKDLSVTETPTSQNPTVLRNAVYQELLKIKPGMLRYMQAGAWACTPMSMVEPDGDQRQCGFDWYHPTSTNTGVVNYAISFPDVLQIANAISAEPWLTMSFGSQPSDFAGMIEYLGGTCGNGNPWTALRCNAGQTTPWTTVFSAKGQKINLEYGNEVWNSGNNGAYIYSDDGISYGNLVDSAFTAARAATDYNAADVNLIADGWGAAGQTGAEGGWAQNVLTEATGTGKPDLIDIAPYQFNVLSVYSSNAAVFQPMFAEPVNLDTVGGNGTPVDCETYAASKSVGCAVYENNVSTTYGVTGITQAQLNQFVGGMGAGLALGLHDLLMMRDSAIARINNFTLTGQYNGITLCNSTTSCTSTTSAEVPIWAENYMMADGAAQTSGTYTIDRPTALVQEGINQAIGSKLSMLNATISSDPTYSIAASQPAPNNGGANTIAANSAVPYVQQFAFSDGVGYYSLILFNVNLTSTEAVTFAGAGAPTGTVTKTVYTASAITTNNELLTIGQSCNACAPTPTLVSNPTGDTLAPYSMTTYTWSTSSSPPSPIGLSGKVALSGKVQIQ